MNHSRALPLLSTPDASLTDTLRVLQSRELVTRRQALHRIGVGSLLAIAPLEALACTVIPSETAGPFPANGTNGRNVLNQSGIVRSDIRASFGAAGTTIAAGTPVTVTLQLQSVGDHCAPLAGYAVYLWHCDATGQYSMYSPGAATQNYLRGVQATDASGKVTFTSIYPSAYPGRWPHMHFEVYRTPAQAVSGTNALKTSQIALPEAASREVYAQSTLYPSSAVHLKRMSLASDGVFGDDGGALELATASGSISGGYAISLPVGIAQR